MAHELYTQMRTVREALCDDLLTTFPTLVEVHRGMPRQPQLETNHGAVVLAKLGQSFNEDSVTNVTMHPEFYVLLVLPYEDVGVEDDIKLAKVDAFVAKVESQTHYAGVMDFSLIADIDLMTSIAKHEESYSITMKFVGRSNRTYGNP